MNKIDVSIIIVSYNTCGLLQACLDALYKQTESISFEVFVVDNASVDQSLEMVHSYFKEVKVIALKENIGFGKANNEAIRVAKGRNIFLLNPDTILLNNAVKILSDFLDKHLDVAICGGNLYSKEGKPIHSHLMYLPSLYGEFDRLCRGCLSFLRYGKSIDFNYTDKPIKVGYITGADLMIRKEVLDKVGVFDPDFFMYYEETELTYRVHNAGFDVTNVPFAKIIHLEGQSLKLKEVKETMFLTSRRLYFLKTLKYKWAFIFCQMIFGMDIIVHLFYYRFWHKDHEQLKIWRFRYKHF